MPVNARWYDEKRHIIIFEFEEDWTWDEYHIARQTCFNLLNSINYAVDQIYDLTATGMMPEGAVSKFWRVATTKHHNTSGVVVGVATSRLLNILTNSIKNVIHKTVQGMDISCVNDIEQAEQYILQQRNNHHAQS